MADLEATIIHDLAGSMTSITGLAEIVALRPDLPTRESLIETLASESRVATQTVKDLQLFRAIRADAVAESPGSVSAADWFALLRDELPGGLRETIAPPPPDLPPVHADAVLLAELVARTITAVGEVTGGSPLGYSTGAGTVVMEVASSAPYEELEEGRASGRKHLRPLALADLLLPRWGATQELSRRAEAAAVRFLLKVSVS